MQCMRALRVWHDACALHSACKRGWRAARQRVQEATGVAAGRSGYGGAPAHQELVLLSVAARDDEIPLGGHEPEELLEPVHLSQLLNARCAAASAASVRAAAAFTALPPACMQAFMCLVDVAGATSPKQWVILVLLTARLLLVVRCSSLRQRACCCSHYACDSAGSATAMPTSTG
jgi:hypothetical protein